MEQNRETDVWQRVLSRQEQAQELTLAQMHRQALELAEAYRQLAKKIPQRVLLRELWEGEQTAAACLRGLGELSGGRIEGLKVWVPAGEKPGTVLARCYRQTNRCMVEYTARSADREYGAVYQLLAKQALRRCALIAQLLGKTGGTG